MKLYRTSAGAILQYNQQFFLLNQDWDSLLNQPQLINYLQEAATNASAIEADWLDKQTILAPIGSQEVWAAGVTYFRSKVARMEEAEAAGGGNFYDKVYDAERPEIFFKATPNRVVGTGGQVRIRKDSTWDVPEPELTLCINNVGKIVGYTIGNDMSSRSIEGENPLYLPQAKVYDGCAGLGPCVYITDEPLLPETRISLEIRRNTAVVFGGEVTISQIKRRFDELVEFLYRETSFPTGCFLMTGTGIVPTSDFTLQSGDEVSISIEYIGTLVNTVA